MIDFGTQLRRLRTKKGLTQQQVGMACGAKDENAARSMVSNWEKGHGYPPIPKFLVLCKVLKTTPNIITNYVEWRKE